MAFSSLFPFPPVLTKPSWHIMPFLVLTLSVTFSFVWSHGCSSGPKRGPFTYCQICQVYIPHSGGSPPGCRRRLPVSSGKEPRPTRRARGWAAVQAAGFQRVPEGPSCASATSRAGRWAGTGVCRPQPLWEKLRKEAAWSLGSVQAPLLRPWQRFRNCFATREGGQEDGGCSRIR